MTINIHVDADTIKNIIEKDETVYLKLKDSEIVKLVLFGLKEKCKTCGGSCFNGYEWCDVHYEKRDLDYD